MILYRARTIASRPTRHPPFEGNGPEIRIRGRWFTSDLACAIAHRAGLAGDTEIVMVDVEEAVAETFRVATTPRTQCGLDPIHHSRQPLTDYVLPMFRVMEAEAIAIAGTDRVRDHIDVSAPARERAVRIVHPPEVLPLAA